MSDDIEKRKAEVEKLSQLGRLVEKYAQSRSLELLIGMGLFAVNVILILLWVRLMFWKEMWWWVRSIVSSNLTPVTNFLGS